MKQALTGKQRRHLRALAHDQKAVVQVGHSGLTGAVVEAVNVALETHELIKVKVLREAPEEPAALVSQLEKSTRCAVVQEIGRTLLLYRRRKENPKITLPKTTPAKSGDRE